MLNANNNNNNNNKSQIQEKKIFVDRYWKNVTLVTPLFFLQTFPFAYYNSIMKILLFI